MKPTTMLIFFALSVLSIDATAVSYLRPDMSFTRARALLLKDNWKPVPMHLDDNYEYDGAEKELVRRKFMEVDSCSNDSARCILYYRKASRCLRLDTIGEHVPEMKVVRWTDECPMPVNPPHQD